MDTSTHTSASLWSTVVALDLRTGVARATDTFDDHLDPADTLTWFIRPTETVRVNRVLTFLSDQWKTITDGWTGTLCGHATLTDAGLTEANLVHLVLDSIRTTAMETAA